MASSMFGSLIRIDCSTRTAAAFSVDAGLAPYIGGMGYGTKILLDEVDPRIDPVSEKNKIILTVGPLTGTTAPMFPQACIVTKSPLTGTILNCYAGGFLGAEIKFCGIDGVILEGRAPQWSLVLVEDGKVSFHDAGPVMGKATAETEQYMKEQFGSEVKTLSIGRAGEKAVAMASIFSETRTFGRGGAGAVLGSKRIKGMAFKGTKAVDVADRKGFAALTARNIDIIKAACAEQYNLVGMFSRVGTGAGMGLINSKGALATKNHVYGAFPEGSEIDGYAYAKKYYTRAISCFGCPVHCGMLHKYKKRDNTDSWLRGPEYETMFSLGSDLLNKDPVTLAEANQLCEDYGMDTLTVGVTMAWAFEMAEKGILKDPDFPLAFGDSDSILGLIRKIGEREGIGDLLADGPKKAAEKTGKGTIGVAMQIKNSGFAAWMPRRMKGVALAFATSNRGACHKRAPIGDEIMGRLDMDSYQGKAPIVKDIQDTVNAIFTFVACRFHEFIAPKEIYPQFLQAATGSALSFKELVTVGERIWNLERIFNVAAGFSRKDDNLPDRCFEPIKGEASKGAVIKREEFEAMLSEYYAVRGWTLDGVPTRETLARLGLGQYARLMG
jgi:aldehyde:ferredoxin oxidoreductase